MKQTEIIKELEKISLLVQEYKEKYDDISKNELSKESVSMDFEGLKSAIDTLLENLTDKSPEHELWKNS